MNAPKKKSALTKYLPLKEGKTKEEIEQLLLDDEKGYSNDEVAEILTALFDPNAGAPEAKKVDPANTEHDEYQIKLESDGKKFTGATVMKLVAVRKIHPANAKSLNAHSGNSLTCYFKKGTYKVSDQIGVNTLREIAPGFNWGKFEEI